MSACHCPHNGCVIADREPLIPVLPREVDLSRGRRVTSPHRDWWSSRSPLKREADRLTCQGCPVVAACAAWAVHLSDNDTTVYSGIGHNERLHRKRPWPDGLR
jgi:hypothetical protein